jgi:hypothetical protein
MKCHHFVGLNPGVDDRARTRNVLLPPSKRSVSRLEAIRSPASTFRLGKQTSMLRERAADAPDLRRFDPGSGGSRLPFGTFSPRIGPTKTAHFKGTVRPLRGRSARSSSSHTRVFKGEHGGLRPRGARSSSTHTRSSAMHTAVFVGAVPPLRGRSARSSSLHCQLELPPLAVYRLGSQVLLEPLAASPRPHLSYA